MPPSRDEPHLCSSRDPPSPPPRGGLRRFLSETNEQEVLDALHELFQNEQRITSDDVRFVVRDVVSHGGTVAIALDFPPAHWVLEFKRAHSFTQLGSFAFGLPEHLNVGLHSRSSSIARVTSSSGGSSDDERDRNEQSGSRYTAAHEPSTFGRFSIRLAYDSDSQLQHTRRRQQQQQQQQQHQRRSIIVDDHRTGGSWQQRDHTWDRKELGSNTSSGSFDSENGTTTGDSSNSSVSASAAPSTTTATTNRDNSESSQDIASTSNENRGYKLSHTVPPETWEKAIAAVEQQGMSLRAAAKIYGVHFAALHRRVKKRAQGGQSSKYNNAYLHPSDEAGIMRVVVARAELGVLMTFDELMKLVEAAALRKLPDISVENARNLMVRFQSRNEQSVRHIIEDWPPPVPTVSSGSSASHYHLEHPGYDHGSKSPLTASMQRSFAGRVAGQSTTATEIAAAPSQFLLPPCAASFSSPINGSNSRPVLPSMSVKRTSMRPPAPGSVMPSQPPQLQQPQRMPRDQVLELSHPVMFV